ncbi:MerR family transcriptional regulator [Metabacillus malikii]|uniref:DNA-binding transcriptional MerR regulator n=1 Tax=Metabacillus malikii TaxID=1504265 RepID=A0ABT9ZL57_9BACI|nr:MerR family transcriptional regulator [Metabacillus malikii]MDQ0231950.1 DNA-binding transcriptional MerR regulator [Metabacillus malikii]
MTTKYVTISKAASIVGEKVFILKNWETEFQEFLSIERDVNNSRIITAEQIEIFRKIKSFKDNHLDTHTIKQLLVNHGAVQQDSSTDKGIDNQSLEEIKDSLQKITEFIESHQMKEVLDIKNHLNVLEHNVVESVNQKIVETATLQTEVSRIEFSDVQDMISNLSDTSEQERERYQQELRKERDIIQRQTDEREERFLAFLKQYQERQERAKQGSKLSFSMLKQYIPFVTSSKT